MIWYSFNIAIPRQQNLRVDIIDPEDPHMEESSAQGESRRPPSGTTYDRPRPPPLMDEKLIATNYSMNLNSIVYLCRIRGLVVDTLINIVYHVNSDVAMKSDFIHYTFNECILLSTHLFVQCS